MKRIATITENGNCLITVEEGKYTEYTIGVIGPVDRIEDIGGVSHVHTTSGCAIWADEIRREQ